MADSRYRSPNPRPAWTEPDERDNVLQRLEGLHMKIPQLDDFFRRFNEQYIATKEDFINLKLEYEKKIDHTSSNAATVQTLESKLTEADEIILNLRAEKGRLEQMVLAKQEELENKARDMKKLEDEQRKNKDEIANLRSRLSQVMGNKLTDNNPAIADLSDKNRPSKLGEKFSELYDNAWTDAFEEIQKSYDEKETIKKLLQILMYVNEKCKALWKGYTANLEKAFKAGSQIIMPDFIMKQLKDLAKSLAPELVEHVYKQLRKNWYEFSTRSFVSLEMCEPFVRGCVECCWLMVAQDPPVMMDCKERRAEGFDHNLFRPYTKTGDILEYVVWPPLYLHENGALLCKGVAQAIKTIRAKSAPAASQDRTKMSNENNDLMKSVMMPNNKQNKNMDSINQSSSTYRATPISTSVPESERNSKDQKVLEQPNPIETMKTNYQQTVVSQAQDNQGQFSGSSNYPKTDGFSNWKHERFPSDYELRTFTHYTNRNFNECQIRQYMGDYRFELCRDYLIYMTRNNFGRK